MLKALPFLLLLAVVHCQIGNNGKVASVLQGTFGSPTAAGPSTIVPPINAGAGGEDLSCKREDGTDGLCVIFYLCDQNNTINDDGVGIIDIRAGESPCPLFLDTCCLPRDVRPPDNPITPPPPPKNEGCGWSNPKGADMRTTGETNGETKFGEFPWVVAVLKKEPLNEIERDGQKMENYVGGGSLIAPNVVLTAAHIASSGPLKIRAGEWDTANTKEIYPYQERDVITVETHKDFIKDTLFYDVALLFLAQPVDLAPNVGLACLPPPQEKTPPGTKCFATGWGKDKFGKEGQYQVILKKVEVPVVERNTCQTALRSTRLGQLFMLHSTFMCAGGEKGKDTCKGDGGSPLSCPIMYEEGRYVQSGIVAWGIGCGDNGIPGVYVDIAKVRTWIDDRIKLANVMDPRIYTA